MQRSSNIEDYEKMAESNPAIVTEILKEMNKDDDMNESNRQHNDQQMNSDQQMNNEQQMNGEQQMNNVQYMNQNNIENPSMDTNQNTQNNQGNNLENEELLMNNYNDSINNHVNNQMEPAPEHPMMQNENNQLIKPPTIQEIRDSKGSIDDLQDPLKVIAIFILLSLPLWDKVLSVQLGKFIHSSNVLSLSIISLKGILAGIIFYVAKKFV